MINSSPATYKLYTPRKLIIGTTEFSTVSCKASLPTKEKEEKNNNKNYSRTNVSVLGPLLKGAHECKQQKAGAEEKQVSLAGKRN